MSVQQEVNLDSYGSLHDGGPVEPPPLSATPSFDSERAPLLSGNGQRGDKGEAGDGSLLARGAQFRATHFPKLRPWGLAMALLVGLVIRYAPILDQPGHEPAHKCLAMVLGVAILWATEAVPLFAGALIVPIPVVIMQMLCLAVPDPLDPTSTNTTLNCHLGTYGAEDTARKVAEAMFDPVILLFLGGFTIAAAVNKYGLNRSLAVWILRRAGTSPRRVVLGVMILGVFMSMWVSNVAAAVLCVAVATPLIENMPSGSNFPKAMLLGIALSNNVGGMTTPIASPQNAIALQSIGRYSVACDGPCRQPTFLQWLFVSVPVCTLCTVVGWLLVCALFPPKIKHVSIAEIEKARVKWGFDQYFVLAVTGVTIVLWIVQAQIKDVIGNIGITALLPIVVFYGLGMLTAQDFSRKSGWDVLMLMGGGLALGYAVQNSNLLNLLTAQLQSLVGDKGSWIIQLTFTSFVAVLANFISSTIAAIIVMPVLASFPTHARLITVSGALMTSGAMALPVSSFPNALCFGIKSAADGQPFLRAIDYIKLGTVMALVVIVVLQSVLYGIATAMGW